MTINELVMIPPWYWLESCAPLLPISERETMTSAAVNCLASVSVLPKSVKVTVSLVADPVVAEKSATRETTLRDEASMPAVISTAVAVAGPTGPNVIVPGV